MTTKFKIVFYLLDFEYSSQDIKEGNDSNKNRYTKNRNNKKLKGNLLCVDEAQW